MPYDENPYDDVTLDEALQQLYERFNDRTIRQAIFVMKDYIGGGSGGTSNYNLLLNKPAIDGVELNKNSTADELGLTKKEVLDAYYTIVAADAKFATIATVTGLTTHIANLEDVVSELKEDITNLTLSIGKYGYAEPYVVQEFEIGALTGNGLATQLTTRIRSREFLNIENLLSIEADNEQLFIVAWDETAKGYGETGCVGGWNGKTFGILTGAWVSSIDVSALKTKYPTYKFGLSIRYADNSEINTVYDLLSSIRFISETNDNVETALDKLFAESGKQEIKIPFESMKNLIKIYNENGNYHVSTKPTDYVVKKDNGKVIFISPNGSDSANGLTILTPVKTLNKALSISNVETIIFLEGEYIANTNFDIGSEINISVNFIGIGNVVIDNISGSNNAPINFKSSCYVRNIHFKHGNNTVKATLSNDEVAVFDECTFSNSDGALWSNGLSILGGISYIFNCTAYNNAYDGFNYHANENVINYAFEIGCKSYNNGNTDLSSNNGQSSNATTSHDGSYIVRVNGDYYACHGGVVADLNCYSANYGCKTGVSTVTNETSYADRMSNYWCSDSLMYLYDCTSYGSKYDTAIVNSGTIISNIQYASNYKS